MITHDDGGTADTRARKQARARTEARAAVSDLAVRLEALRHMTVAELHAEYRRLFGEPSHSRNRSYLRKKLAFRTQELEVGGTPQRARDRIEHLLGLDSALRLGPQPELPRPAKDDDALAAGAASRDPRLPPPGTVLRRQHGGEEHLVTVEEEGFEYRGRRFTSLSTLAKEISGKVWNGFAFFSVALRAAQPAAPSKQRKPA
jgi:hypothetical protein